MSQVNIGEEFLQGGLSGLKMAALMQELKRAKLDNAEFQATAGHRQVMNQLAEAKGQSDLQYQAINSSILQQTLANMPDTATAQAENQTRLEQGKANVALTKSQADTTYRDALTQANTKETNARAGLIDAQAAEQYARVASQLGQSAGFAGSAGKTQITAEDASSLTDAMLGQMQVDDSQKIKAKAFLMPQVLNSALGAQQQRDMLEQDNAAQRTQRKQQVVANLADMASRTNDPMATLDQLGPHFADPESVAAAKAVVSNGLISRDQQKQEDRPMTGAEERVLRNPLNLVEAAKSELQDLIDKKSNNVKTIGGGIFKSGVPIDKAIEQAYAKVDRTQAEYDRLKESLRPKQDKGSTTVKLKSAVDNPGPKTPADWVAEVKADPKFQGKSSAEIAAEARRRAGVK